MPSNDCVKREIRGTMHSFRLKTLRGTTGKVVTARPHALAIAFSGARGVCGRAAVPFRKKKASPKKASPKKASPKKAR
jgi:hypothetical protein